MIYYYILSSLKKYDGLREFESKGQTKGKQKIV